MNFPFFWARPTREKSTRISSGWEFQVDRSRKRGLPSSHLTKRGAFGKAFPEMPFRFQPPRREPGTFGDGGAFNGVVSDDTVAELLTQRCGSEIGTATSGMGNMRIYSLAIRFHSCSCGFYRRRSDGPVRPPGELPGWHFPDGGWNLQRNAADQFTVKVDHRINDKQNFGLAYYFNDSNLVNPGLRISRQVVRQLSVSDPRPAIALPAMELTHNWTLITTW